MGWDPEYAPTIKAGFLHHTVDSNGYRPADVPAILRAVYAYHAVTRDWGDIGYNFVVDRFGRIWEGRFGGVDSAVVGAHTGGFNYGTVGVAMLGTYSTAPVPAAVLASVARVFGWKLASHYRNPYGIVQLRSAGGGTSRYRRGAVVTKHVISGHRDVGNTACPGLQGYAQLPRIRALAAALIGTGLVDPVLRPATVGVLAPGPRLSAGLIRPSLWSVAVTDACTGRLVRRYTGSGSRLNVGWDLRDAATSGWARAGSYAMTAAAAAGGRTGVPYTGGVTVLPPVSVPAPPTGEPPAPGPAGFVPVPPVRVLDTRGPLGGGTGQPLSTGSRIDVPVLGVGPIPASGVAAVLVTVVSMCSTAGNWVTAWPAGEPRPAGAAVAAAAGTVTARTVVPVGAGGRISVGVVHPLADVVAEVVGYLPLAGGLGYHRVDPRRLIDATAAPLAPGETRLLDVRARSGGAVPAAATAVTVNLAVARPTGAGYLRVYPAASLAFSASGMSYVPGGTQSQRVLTGLSSAGQIRVRNVGRTPARVIADLSGWYGPADLAGGALFTGLPRTRLLDRRIDAAQTVSVPLVDRAGVPAAATTVLAQVSAYGTRNSYLTAWRSGAGRPGVEDVSLAAGRWWANLVPLPVGTDGSVQLFNRFGATRVVVDLLGYYAP